MKPARFLHAAPRTLDEALALLARAGDEAKLLAGGQSLVPMLNLRLTKVTALVDLNRVAELSFVRRENGMLRVGSLVRHAEIERSKEIREAFPLLGRVAGEIGHLAIRNRGTIGGSLVHADPAAEWPLAALATGASLVLRSASRTRTVPASEFFLGPLMSAAAPDEALVEIRFPLPGERTRFGFVELARRPGDFAIVAAACRIVGDASGRCVEATIAVGGADSRPLRIARAEEIVAGTRGAEAVDAAAEAAAAAVDPSSDVHGSAEFRRKMVHVLVRRALHEALGTERVPSRRQ